MRRKVALVGVMAMLASLLLVVPALASHPEVSLPGSNFEIDTNANIKLDDPAPSQDWASVPQGTTAGTERRQPDSPSGAADESFGQGAKEDTAVPTVVNGSIPPNKSDLKFFGGYLETTPTGAQFLNIYWTRVQEPSGTTNMDFEFNKSSTISGNGVTPVRTAGDVLIQYDLAQGGTNPQLFLSRWVTTGPGSQCVANNTTPCWGNTTASGQPPRVNLTAAGDATGSINTTQIPQSESDGLGIAPNGLSPRTFGEAQIDFTAFAGGEDECVSFGSAYLKSRSSDSFTAALKDFIPPLTLNFDNCGDLKITKTDDGTPASVLAGAKFDVKLDNAPLGVAPDANDTLVAQCTTNASGECLIEDILAGDYWVIETEAPAGYDLASPAFQLVTVTNSDTAATVTFVDPAQLGAIKITKTAKNKEAENSSIPLAGVTFTITGGNLPAGGTDVVTGANGKACLDGLAFATDYVATEGAVTDYVPDGTGVSSAITVDNKASCADDPYVGEEVSFNNLPLTDIQVSVDSHVVGGTASTVDCVDSEDVSVGSGSTTTGGDTAAGEVAADDLAPGTYVCTIVIDP